MQFTTSVLALIASSGLVAAVPGGGWGGKGHMTSSCWTKSTCAASTYYSTETEKKPETVTKVYTSYKTEAYTTEIPKTYYSTKYSTFTQFPVSDSIQH
jgi:hypothetical protein